MGSVIKFPARQELTGRDREAKRLMAIADEIDSVILKHLDEALEKQKLD